MKNQNDNWTFTWPTTPGNYWFHGWLHKCNYSSKPKTYLVKAAKLGNSTNLALVTEDLYKFIVSDLEWLLLGITKQQYDDLVTKLNGFNKNQIGLRLKK